jgi:hypothetical protein
MLKSYLQIIQECGILVVGCNTPGEEGQMMNSLGLTVNEASQESGYHPEHIRRLLRSKAIRGRKVGLMYFINSESLRRYVRKARSANDRRFGPRR